MLIAKPIFGVETFSSSELTFLQLGDCNVVNGGGLTRANHRGSLENACLASEHEMFYPG